MSGGGGGGSANAAQGQIQADEMRGSPGTMSRWDKGERRRLFIALLPLILVSLTAFLLAR